MVGVDIFLSIHLPLSRTVKWDHIHNTISYWQLLKRPNKLDFYNEQCYKRTNTLSIWAIGLIAKKMKGSEYGPRRPYTQHYILLATIEKAQ
jgi:hypothetical protein